MTVYIPLSRNKMGNKPLAKFIIWLVLISLLVICSHLLHVVRLQIFKFRHINNYIDLSCWSAPFTFMDTFFFELAKFSFSKSCYISILKYAMCMHIMHINRQYSVDLNPVGRIAKTIFNQKILKDKLRAIFDEIIIRS